MRRKSMSPLRAGVIALVIVLIGCYLGFTKSIPFRSHFEIKAAFQSSNELRTNSPVRIAGVEVGKVTKVEPTSKGAASAVVTMRIKDSGRPIHADATAKIRPRIFLEGNFFVDLTAGSAGTPVLEDGDTIPATQTSTPVQFDQVLKALKAPTRLAAQQTLGELAAAYKAGLADSFNRSLEDQAPGFRFSAIVLEALLGREPDDLSGVIRDTADTAAALDSSPPRLRSFLENFNRTAAALAVERDDLEATIAELPRTLAAATPALDSLNAAFPDTRRLAVEALPAVRSSGPAVAALRPFVRELRGLLGEDELRGLTRDLRRATPGLTRVSTGAVPLLGHLRSLSSCLNETVLPWSNDTLPDPDFPATGPVFEEAVKWLPGLAGESRSFDANGMWFKVLGSGGLETFQLGEGILGLPLLPVAGVNPPPPTTRPPLEPEVPCETQEPPDLRTIAGQAPASRKTSPDDPAYRARYEKAKQTALVTMTERMRQGGLDVTGTLKDATRGVVDSLARRAGNVAQLEVLRDGLPLTSRNIRRAGG